LVAVSDAGGSSPVNKIQGNHQFHIPIFIFTITITFTPTPHLDPTTALYRLVYLSNSFHFNPLHLTPQSHSSSSRAMTPVKKEAVFEMDDDAPPPRAKRYKNGLMNLSKTSERCLKR
jgi:hypothetical protein